MAARSNVEVVISAKDEATSVINGVGRGIEGFKGQILALAGVATGVVAAIGAVTKASVDLAAGAEQNRISFETMLGSADKAKKMMADLAEFTLKTPFEMTQVVEGSKKLLAYGISAEKVIPTFKMLGDIAAGVGMEKLPQLTLAFGQVNAATRLTGMELRQFTEAGVPLLQALTDQANKAGGSWQVVGGGAKKAKIDVKETGDQLAIANQRLKEMTDSGKAKESSLMSLRNRIENYNEKLAQNATVSEGTRKVWVKSTVTVKDMVQKISDGEVSFDMVQKALQGMTDKGGKFNEMMLKQSTTYAGLMSNIRDKTAQTMAEIAGVSMATGEIREGSLFAILKDAALMFFNVLTAITPFLVTLSQNAAVVGAILAGVFVIAAIPIVALIILLGPLILLFIKIVAVAMLIGAAIGGLVMAWQAWGDEVMAFIPVFTSFFVETLPTAIANVVTAIINWFMQLPAAIQNYFYNLFVIQIPYAVGFVAGWLSVKIPELINNMIKWIQTLPQRVMAIYELKNKLIQQAIMFIIGWLGQQLSALPGKVDSWIQAIPGIANRVFQEAGKLIEAAMNAIVGVVKRKWDEIKAIFDAIVKAANDAWNAAQRGFNAGQQQAKGGKQAGGIVPGAIGQPVLVPAHGGEMITPHGVGAGVGSGGGGVNLTVHVGLYAGSETEKRNIARELYAALLQVAISQNKTVADLMGG